MVIIPGADHENEDSRLVSLSEDVERSLVASHDPQTQTVVAPTKLHRLVGGSGKRVKHIPGETDRMCTMTLLRHDCIHRYAVHR